MASQITHVVYGKKIFERHEGFSWPDFLVGTLFPDIRYLAKVDRDKLHGFNTSEEKIPRNNSFRAGMYAHWLVDEKRERFISEKGIYELLPKGQYATTSLKLVEDDLSYDHIDNWKEIVIVLDTYLKEEECYGIEKGIIKEWHGLLKKYFKQKPNPKSWGKMILALGFEKEISENILNQVRAIKQNKEIVAIIKTTFEII